MTGFPDHLIGAAIDAALAEDLGLAGDITTNAIIAADSSSRAVIAARKPGRIAGLPLAEAAFRRLDPFAEFRVVVADGQDAEAGAVIAEISGNTRALLTRRAGGAEFPRPSERHRHHDARLYRGDPRDGGAVSAAPARRRRACAPSRNTPCAWAAASTTASACSMRC